MADHEYEYLDNAGLSYFWTKIKLKLSNKVDKVSGKGLSTNDFTNAYKTKIDNMDTHEAITNAEIDEIVGTIA